MPREIEFSEWNEDDHDSIMKLFSISFEAQKK